MNLPPDIPAEFPAEVWLLVFQACPQKLRLRQLGVWVSQLAGLEQHVHHLLSDSALRRQVAEAAVTHGQLPVLRWALDSHPPCGVTLFILAGLAIRQGQLPLLQWLVAEHGTKQRVGLKLARFDRSIPIAISEGTSEHHDTVYWVCQELRREGVTHIGWGNVYDTPLEKVEAQLRPTFLIGQHRANGTHDRIPSGTLGPGV